MSKKIIPCFIWIFSVLVFGLLLWVLAMPYRTRLLTETVNKTLAESGSERIEMQDNFSFSPASVMGGTWFSLRNSSDKAFVFTMIRNGTTAACVGIVDGGGKVKTILPLSGNARQIIEIKELPLSIYRFYTDRIEQDWQNRNQKREVFQ